MVRALLSLGTACALKPTAQGGLNRGLDKGFELSDLERPGSSVIRHRYLNEGKGMRYHFLFHATVQSRHIIGLFSPGAPAKIYVVDGARNRQQLPNPSRWYAERVEKATPGIFEYPSELECVIDYFPNEDRAMRQLVKDLQAIRTGLNVIALCSPFEHAYYQARHSIFSEFPFFVVRTIKDEEASLMWLVNTARRMVVQYLRLSSWIAGQIETAAHYDVPVGVSSPCFLANFRTSRLTRRYLFRIWRLHAGSNNRTWYFGGHPRLDLISEVSRRTPTAVKSLSLHRSLLEGATRLLCWKWN